MLQYISAKKDSEIYRKILEQNTLSKQFIKHIEDKKREEDNPKRAVSAGHLPQLKPNFYFDYSKTKNLYDDSVKNLKRNQ